MKGRNSEREREGETYYHFFVPNDYNFIVISYCERQGERVREREREREKKKRIRTRGRILTECDFCKNFFKNRFSGRCSNEK